MHQIIKTTFVMAAILSITACSVEGPKVKLRPPITVEVEGDGHHHNRGDGGFCPPGQAKKGNC